MKPIYYGFIMAALAPLMTSCGDDNPWNGSTTEGGIMLTVNTDCTVRDAIPTRSEAYAPDASELGVRLTKNDGTYSREWAKVGDFDTSALFKAGEYLLEAFYGNADDEGYRKPYYHGQTTLNVRPGEQTETEVTATLANTMVSIDYTDNFKNYFKEYTTMLHSQGYGNHEVDNALDEAIYLVPGTVTITVDFTKQNGKSARIQPAEFVAEARHHYHVTLDVNDGNVGDAQLLVKFDDTIVEEDVTIDLSDELLDMPEPEVTANGFTHEAVIESLEGTPLSMTPKMSVFAAGKITSAYLTIESDTYTPAFGREIDLANCTPSQQEQVTAAGIRAIGFFKNPDKMATLDLSGVFEKLPAGTHRFTLVVKDRLTRVNEPVTMVVHCNPLEIGLVSTESSAFGSTSANITVSYNGTNLTDNLKVKAMGDNGAWIDCKINSAAVAGKARRTRSAAFPAQNYRLSLTIPNTSRDTDIELFYKGVSVGRGVIERTMPEYTMKANAFASKVILKVECDNDSYIDPILSNIRVFNGTTEIPASQISVNKSTHEVTVTGLSAGTAYTLSSTCSKNPNPVMGASVSFTTEAALQPQNGDMEAWSSIDVGYKTWGLGRTDIKRWFPWSEGGSAYWDTRNMLTSDQKPSSVTYNYTCYSATSKVDGVTGSAAEIKTLGFGDGSTNAGSASIVYHRAAGMLFMGDYTYTYSAGKYDDKGYNDNTYFKYGRPFTSRPSSLQFDYKFKSYNSESFKAYVVIENRNGSTVTELARGEFESNSNVNNFTTKTVAINYTNKNLKATHAYVVFISSTAGSPSTEASGGIHVGNVLTVDNIRFNY